MILSPITKLWYKQPISSKVGTSRIGFLILRKLTLNYQNLAGCTARAVEKRGEDGDGDEEHGGAAAGCAGGAHRQTRGAHQPAPYDVSGAV